VREKMGSRSLRGTRSQSKAMWIRIAFDTGNWMREPKHTLSGSVEAIAAITKVAVTAASSGKLKSSTSHEAAPRS
jgi:hypothetical protein